MDFVDVLKDIQNPPVIGMDDISDKLSFIYSVLIFLLCSTLVTAKQYIMSPISCFAPTLPTTATGDMFMSYMESYCWVHGTVILQSHQRMPQNKEWDKLDQDRVTYYQWIPFVLGIQCLFFYIPRLIWRMFCFYRFGSDMEQLVTSSKKAMSSSGDERASLVGFVTNNIEDLLYCHRDNRQGTMSKCRRLFYKYFSFLLISKRLGTWLILTYMMVKMLYLLNAIGQIFWMKSFLGLGQSMSMFGIRLLEQMKNGTHNDENNRFFPRVGYCRMKNVRQLGARENAFVAQCALPVNLLSEKLYIFLWFWTTFVAIMTALSIPTWIYKVYAPYNRYKFVKRLLFRRENFKLNEFSILKRFINDFLRHDGVFLLRMIAQNAGDIITAEVVSNLWTIYKKKYSQRSFRCDYYDGSTKQMGEISDSNSKMLNSQENVDFSCPAPDYPIDSIGYPIDSSDNTVTSEI